MENDVRVLVVDDEADLRLLVRGVLQSEPRFTVVGEAAGGEEALTLFDELQPDAIVLDYRMPDLNGLEVADRILRAHPDTPIILFSAFLDADTRSEAEQIGVKRCLSKDKVFDLSSTLSEVV